MKVIICIDDDCGMLFNKRRQSRDSKLIEDINALTDKLYITSFSEKLFKDAKYSVTVNDSMLDIAGKDDFCFVEDRDISPYENKIDKIIIYKWNRRYPSDFKFTFDLKRAGFSLASAYEFEGTSHEKITREVFEK
ncbi:MAG: ribonuclease Z [Clostridia bacterium]|nr:ribonuclease Z [Clostridia bacterium]